MSLFFSEVLKALKASGPSEKCDLTSKLYEKWHQCLILKEKDISSEIEDYVVGRPEKPVLVSPKQLTKRKLSTPEGHAALIHSLAHIEFNAINLALDACYRFQDMPEQYYQDWLKVAYEEAYHFQLLNTHLHSLGYTYGDFVAHNGLWEMAEKTAYDVLVRMALVPRLMEARGLDVAPSIREKLMSIQDNKGADILSIIMDDEEGHVIVGNYWYNTLCKEREVNGLKTFMELIQKFAPSFLKGPYELDARRRAGFTEEELAFLTK